MLKLFYFITPILSGVLFPASVVCTFPNNFGLLIAVICEIATAYFILDESRRKS